MAQERRLWVSSFFVNINVGDGTIHILYSCGQDGIKRVERAILLDGGKANKELNEMEIEDDSDSGDDSGDEEGTGDIGRTHPNIANTIINIEDMYACQGPQGGGANKQQNLLQFDAVVISHWDGDHSDGVMCLLLEDVKSQANSYDEDLPNNGIQLRRARYDDLGNPQTFFYAPTWKKNKYHIVQGGSGTIWPVRYDKFFQTGYDNDGTTTLPDNATMSISPGSKVLPETGRNVKIWATDQLIMRIGVDHLLGRDFFSRTDPTVNISTRMFSTGIASLLVNVPATAPDLRQDETLVGPVPAFYCVAVNSRILGGEHFVQFTNKNMSSICNLVIWSASDDNHYVSHYLAGDAHGPLEVRIANWMGYEENDTHGVRILKLSHHGAATSNPVSLWKKLKPYNTVCSAGDAQGYGHPRKSTAVPPMFLQCITAHPQSSVQQADVSCESTA
jgi:hypothetical protein